MGKSLWTVLSADHVDHAELQQVIQRHFPSASQPRLREIVYPGDEPHAVKLVYSKTDQLVGIEAGEALTKELEGQLSRAVSEALLAPAGYKVHRQVLFADHKLTGSWRYRDWFQVLPVPPSAPQLNCVFGDHPFTLEVRVAASRDSGITNLRAGRAMRKVLLLLGGTGGEFRPRACVARIPRFVGNASGRGAADSLSLSRVSGNRAAFIG